MSFYNKNDIIEMAVKMEHNGFAFYDKALQRSDLDTKTKTIITKLRDDEKIHEKTFLALRDKIDNVDIRENSSWEEAQFYMESIVGAHVFDDSGKAIQLAQQAKDVAELLKYAIQFEKDTLLFFYAMSKYVISQKAQKAVNAIINEEMKHIKKLQELTEL